MPLAASALSRAIAFCVLIAVAVVSFVSPPATAAPRVDRPYHPELALVSFETDTTAAQRAAAHASVGGVVVNRLEAAGIDVVRVPEGVDPAVAADRYQRIARVAAAQPNYEMGISSVPNDVLFGQEWGLHNTSQLVAGSLNARAPDFDVDAPEGWDTAFGPGSFPSTGGTRVGVLDTGIDRGHADFLNKVKACASAVTALGIVATGVCEDDNSHGTHVAGTIAAAANNTIGVAGVAPNAELAIFKGLNAGGVGFYADMIAGIHWLHTQGQARIISMSVTGPQDGALDAELSEAAAAGVLLVAAAGNDGDATANWPAHHPGVMSIASVNQSGGRSSFSNCTTDVEVAAPGEDVWSTAPGNAYAILSGTSMATPHVSGVAAMVMWKKGLSAAQTRTTLRSATEDSGGCNGVGIVNLRAALA
jgi:thermitase